MKQLTGTGALLRFALRRDRLFLPLWILSIVAFSVLCAPLFTEVAKTPADLTMYGEIMKNPAMIALCGPQVGTTYTYGVMYIQMMTVWILILVGVMNFFLVSRHTRRDEEDGKIEVLRSLPVGHAAIGASTLIVTVLVNCIIGVLTALGLITTRTPSMSVAGNILFGSMIFVIGMLFAAIAMLLSQLCSTAHGSIGGSFLVLGIFYMLAALGNVQGGALSTISPLSLVFKTAPYVENRIAPIFVLGIESLLIAILAIALSLTRDLGAGLLPQKKGRAHAKKSLSSPFGLAFRLTKKTAITWVILLFVLGLMYGSIFGDFESFIGSSEIIQRIIAAGQGDMILSFMTYITLIMANIAAIPVMNCMTKLRSEEKKNRMEPILSRSVSKRGAFLPYIGIGICLSIAQQVTLSLGLYLAGKVVMAQPFPLGDVLLAGIVKLPGIWLLAGLSVFLTGVLPKRTWLSWVYFGMSFFAIYFGRLADLPPAFVKLTAFGALPDSPIEAFSLLPLLLVTSVAVFLGIAGITQYAHRDTQYS
jgi:ABC-2 type transport system permease protein